MKAFPILTATAFCFSSPFLLTLAAGEYVGGTLHETPIDLDDDSFQAAIEDSANPFWFLKFYAPWCGHCKKMAPVLDSVAPKLKGKMAIGKIDCTKHKAVCKEHKVRGFPTLMYSVDGEVMGEYSGGRDELDIINFAQKMSEPAVHEIRRLEEAKIFAKKTASEGIVFLGSGKADSSLWKVFEKVARKMQANAYFLWMEQLESPTDDGKDYSYVDRIEDGVLEPRRWETTAADLTEENFSAFVKDQNIPTLTNITPQNFRRISRNGRPLLMAIVDMENDELVSGIRAHMMEFILRAPQEYVEQRYYGLFDGKKWQKFLKQFGVKQKDNPQYLMIAPLDSPGEKTFWRNETYTKFPEFLKAIEDGSIPPRHPEKKKLTDDPFGWLTEKFQQFFPYSIIPIFILTGLIVWAITPSIDDYEDYEITEDQKMTEETKKNK